MKRKLGILLIALFCLQTITFGQYGQSVILPDLTDEELLEALVDEYKAPILFFSYGMSRDTMFRYVYGVNDSLSCVYSGHTVYMDPTQDPTITVYMNGSDDGINTEHTFPQSKGASFGNARSDMHHLFPTRAKVNEERSNFAFGDIDDNETDLWFYKDQALFSKPTSNIDEYSEWKWQVFEPRESHKGNVARAMMYFYTMYKGQADEADPNFFSSMVPTLCNWHFLDPVDSLEYARTNLIARWQVNPNPFVLDCSLASRSYCDFTTEACQLAVGIEESTLNEKIVKAYYNESAKAFVTHFDLQKSSEVTLSIFDVAGNLIHTKDFKTITAGVSSYFLPNTSEVNGILFLNFRFKTGNSIITESHKVNVFNN